MSEYSNIPYQVSSGMDDPSSMTISELSSQQVPSTLSISFSQGSLTQEHLCALMVQELDELGTKLQSLIQQYSLRRDSSKISSSSGCSRSNSEDYCEFLNNKEHFFKSLIDAVKASDPTDVPKDEFHAYQELSSMISKWYNEGVENKQEIEKRVEKQISESNQMTSQINIFTKLMEEQNDKQETEESVKSRNRFEEAKQDLDIILKTLYTDEVREQFVSVMSVLVEGYMKNLDTENFVEIPLASLKNPALQLLIRRCLIISHPLNCEKFRLNVD